MKLSFPLSQHSPLQEYDRPLLQQSLKQKFSSKCAFLAGIWPKKNKVKQINPVAKLMTYTRDEIFVYELGSY